MAERKKWKKHVGAVLLALLAALSAFSPLSVKAAAETVENGASRAVIPLEGMTLNRSSLFMKTGEQKSLTVSYVPADTTEEPELVWSSDDPAVARVEGSGTEAVVMAPEGAGGTAVITVSGGGFTASCPVLVTVQEPMLESVLFMQNSSGSNRYELTEGTPGSREFTLRVPENTNVVYVRPQLRDDIFSTAVITARFTDVNTGEEAALELPVDETTSLTSTAGRVIKAYDTTPRELVLEVTDQGRTETYQIHIVRGSYLGGFTLTDEGGGTVAYSPEFKKTTFAYSVHVPSSASWLKLNLTPAEKTSVRLAVNGQELTDGEYLLPLEPGTVTAVLEAGDGVYSVPYAYTLTVYVDEVCYLTVNLDPADAVFAVYDRENVQIDPKDGRYELIKGGTYTYTVSAPGYQSQSGSFTIEGDEEQSYTLEKSADSTLEELEAQWGGYWKNEDNQNIVDAAAPRALEYVEVKWKQQYGANADYSNSVSDGILVEDYICCFSGNVLMYLDRETGEVVKSASMAARGNSSFNKPLYGAGMIFVPLNDGRVQAFHAGTLESLWVYTDTVGGNASTALRYDSGYLYAGFADGNLVCLSVTDEDLDRTDEQKSAVWRKYDSGGYYRTGVYTGEKCLYACGRSGSVYCLDKRTGETLQSLSLPSEAGAASTAVCQDGGRIYFATENGWLFSYPYGEDGRLDEEGVAVLDLGGTVYGTPLVYNGRIYVGSATKDIYGVVLAPYYLNVVQLQDDGSLSLAYRMEIRGCPKGPGTLTTAYEAQEGCVYVYFTTDSASGSVYLLKDRAGAAEPVEGSGLLYQQTAVSGNGGGSVLADSQGNLYIRYESAWLYALKPTDLYLEGVEAEGENVVIDGGAEFDRQAESHSILLDAGADQVTLTFTASQGAVVSVEGREGNVQTVTLTEGRAEIEVLLTMDGQTRVYRFTIRQRSSDAALENLQVSYSPVLTIMQMELEPAFDPEITGYNSSLYGNDAIGTYYVWPLLPEDSQASVRVTVVSGVSGSDPGTEIEPMTVQLAEGPRQRYMVKPASTSAAVVDVTVTAEDGATERTYRLSMFRNNDRPSISAGSGAVVSRQEERVTLKVTANMAGYLYYLPDRKEGTAGLPSANEISKNGTRIAVTAGENTVTLEGFTAEESVVYLYEMSYAQRWSSGIQVEIPAWDGTDNPGPVGPDPPQGDLGDINGDGKITNADVAILLDGVTEGAVLSAEKADMNGDGQVTNADVSLLLELVTSGG